MVAGTAVARGSARWRNRAASRPKTTAPPTGNIRSMAANTISALAPCRKPWFANRSGSASTSTLVAATSLKEDFVAAATSGSSSGVRRAAAFPGWARHRRGSCAKPARTSRPPAEPRWRCAARPTRAALWRPARAGHVHERSISRAVLAIRTRAASAGPAAPAGPPRLRRAALFRGDRAHADRHPAPAKAADSRRRHEPRGGRG